MKKVTKVLISSMIIVPTTTVGVASFYIQPALESEDVVVEEKQLPTVSEITVEKINHNSMLITTDFFEEQDDELIDPISDDQINTANISIYDSAGNIVQIDTGDKDGSGNPIYKDFYPLEVDGEYLFRDLKRGMEYSIQVEIDYIDPKIEDILIKEVATTETTYNWYNRINENIYEEIQTVSIPTEFWMNDYQGHNVDAWDNSPDSILTLEHFFGQLVDAQNITTEAFLTPEGKSTGNINKDKLEDIVVEFQIPKFTSFELPMKPLENDIWFYNRASKYGIILETSGTHYDSITKKDTSWEHTISFGDSSSNGYGQDQWLMKPIHPWSDDEEKIIANSTDKWIWEMNSFNNPEYYEVDFSQITTEFEENLTNITTDENGVKSYKADPSDSFLQNNEPGWFASILLKGIEINYVDIEGVSHSFIYNPMDDLFSIIPLKTLNVPLIDSEGNESTFIIEPFGNKNYKTNFETKFMSWKVSGDELDQISYRQFVAEDTGELDNSGNKVIGDITLTPDNAADIKWNTDSNDKTIGILFITWASLTTALGLGFFGYKKYQSNNNTKQPPKDSKGGLKTNDK